MKLVFPGEFPSLNEYINAERRNRFIAAKIKKETTQRVKQACAQYARTIDYPVHVQCIWYTKNERKDPDNVAFAIKFLLDGIVEAGLLTNDTRKYVLTLTHFFHTDKHNPRVEVSLVQSLVQTL